MDAQKLEQIQKVFANDRFATDNGAVIEQVDEGYAKCWLEIQPHHLNAAGTVMGGAIFTLADFAFAVASNWNKPLPRLNHIPNPPIWVLPEAHDL